LLDFLRHAVLGHLEVGRREIRDGQVALAGDCHIHPDDFHAGPEHGRLLSRLLLARGAAPVD